MAPKTMMLGAAAALMVPVLSARAQLAISWYTVDGGGGVSTGGTFTIKGTIGQCDASGPMTGGTLTVTGGFWAGVASGPHCSNADFDGDGDTGTDADIEAFFLCLAGTCCATCETADFDGDGDTGTDADIEAFFRVLAGGTC